jgi:hypothetical protein
MVRRGNVKKIGLAVVGILIGLSSLVSLVNASPFGQGVFGADVPFGSATSISIDLSGDVPITLAPSGGNFSGTGSHVVTVTSTDVVGYYLYAHTTSGTSMTNGAASIPASTNTSAGSLSVGSWGYNTTGSTTNFLGMPASSVVIKDAAGPYKSGDPTTVTYGALASGTQEAGTYSVAVTYTAVAKNQ